MAACRGARPLRRVPATSSDLPPCATSSLNFTRQPSPPEAWTRVADGMTWRERARRRLRVEAFDLAIVGGGITGAGVARDAALRGLRVALLESGDFASGTSSRSSRLIHGGVRYLEHGHLHLVFESSRE